MNRTTWTVACLGVGLGLLLTGIAEAQPTKVGTAFKINACTGPTCKFSKPSLAGTPSGRFLVAWEGTHVQDPKAIVGRFFTPAGAPQGGDVLVSKPAPPTQLDASAAADKNGAYVVAWTSYSAPNDGDIFVQRFRPNGAALGAPIQVNVDDPANPVPTDDFSPVVSKGADGGFVVAWVSLLPPSLNVPGGPPTIVARRFNATGAPLGPQLKINTGLTSGDRPAACIDGLNRAIVAWSSVNGFFPFEPSKLGVSVRRLNPNGTALGAEIVVAPPVAGDTIVSVGCGKGNLFTAVWQTDSASGGDRMDIMARRYTPAGRPAANGLSRVNVAVAGDQRLPSIAFDAAGNSIIVWSSRPDDEVKILGRRYNPTGAPLGGEFVVDDNLSDDSRPAEPEVAAIGTANNFLVVWRDGVAGLMGQRFKP